MGVRDGSYIAVKFDVTDSAKVTALQAFLNLYTEDVSALVLHTDKKMYSIGKTGSPEIASANVATVAGVSPTSGDVPAASLASALGVYFQPLDATLTALAAVNWSNNSIPRGSGTDTVVQLVIGANRFPGRSSTGDMSAKTISDFAFTFIDDADGPAVRSTIGAETAGAAASAQAFSIQRANHTGTQAAATISDFDTQVRTSRPEQLATPTGALSMGSQKITNLSPGTSGTDAATVQQIADAVEGLWDDRGNYDASVGTFPASGGSGTAGALKKGDIWRISVAGTLGGKVLEIGDTIRALVDAPGQTTGNWADGEHNIGYVPLNASSNLSDVTNASTARTNLGVPAGSGNSTGTNTGDQTAATVSFSPTGGISATTVQNAIVEAKTDAIADAATAAAATYAPLASPALSGNPTTPTPAAGDNDTSIPSTAFVQDEKVAKTTAGFTIPAVYGTVSVAVTDGRFAPAGACLLITDGADTIIAEAVSGGGAIGAATVVMRNLMLFAGAIGATMASGAFCTPCGWPVRTPGTVNVRQFGAKLDGIIATNGSWTGTAVTGTFARNLTSADVGKIAMLVGGAAGGRVAVGTVSAVGGSTSFTFSGTVSVNQSNALVYIGSDDTAAWMAAEAALANMGGLILAPGDPSQAYAGPTVSMHTGLGLTKTNVVIKGDTHPSTQDAGAPNTFRGLMLAYAGTFGGINVSMIPPASGSALKCNGLIDVCLDNVAGHAGYGWVARSVHDLVYDGVYVKNAGRQNVLFSTVAATLAEATDDTGGFGTRLTVRALDPPNRQTDGVAYIANTTVAAGSNAQNITTLNGSGTITVASTAAGAASAAFPTSGTAMVEFQQTIMNQTWRTLIPVTYTGTTGTTLTGCTATNPFSGGSAPMTMATGGQVWLDGAANCAAGIVLDADASTPAGNPSNTTMGFRVIHAHGPGLQMRNSDSMDLPWGYCYKAGAAASVGIGYDIWGGASAATSSRSNHFGKLMQGAFSAAGGMLIRGTDSFAVASDGHIIDAYSRENGEPQLCLGIGVVNTHYRNLGGTTKSGYLGQVTRKALAAAYTNSTVTLSNTLLSDNLEANQTYSFEATLFGGCSGTGGSRFALTLPAGATASYTCIGCVGAANSISSFNATTVNAEIGFTFWSVALATLQVRIVGTITMGSTAGAATIQGKSVTASQVTTLNVGSTLKIEKTA